MPNGVRAATPSPFIGIGGYIVIGEGKLTGGCGHRGCIIKYGQCLDGNVSMLF